MLTVHNIDWMEMGMFFLMFWGATALWNFSCVRVCVYNKNPSNPEWRNRTHGW